MAAPAFPEARAARLAALFAGLMMSVPFLLPRHRLPIASFDAEWLACLLGVLAALALLWRAPLLLPRIAFAPLALAVVVVLQLALGMVAYASTVLIAVAALVWGALLAAVGRSAAATLGLPVLSAVLAWSTLAGGLISALYGLLQWRSLDVLAPGLIWPGEVVGITGNLAQPNHFATQIALALASAAWLRGSAHLGRAAFGAIALPLLGALVLSGSRSGALYLTAIAFVWIAATHCASKPMQWRSVLIPVTCLLGLWLAASTGLFGPRLVRLGDVGEGLGPRVYLWRHALTMFLEHPWLGVGFDGYASTLLGQLGPQETGRRLDPYAHNLGLQMLATCGLAGLAALALPTWGWLRRRRAAALEPAQWWGTIMIAILFIHSMLEQPLYYTYFLGIATFIAGAFDPSGTALVYSPVRRRALAAALSVALVVLGRTAVDYETLASQFYAGDPALVHDARHLALLERLHTTSIFAPLTELIAPERLVPVDAPAGVRLDLNTRLLRYAPVAEVAYRQAALLAESGQPEKAIAQLTQAARAYPAELPFFQARFDRLAVTDGATFAGLAVHARRQQNPP